MNSVLLTLQLTRPGYRIIMRLQDYKLVVEVAVAAVWIMDAMHLLHFLWEILLPSPLPMLIIINRLYRTSIFPPVALVVHIWYQYELWTQPG